MKSKFYSVVASATRFRATVTLARRPRTLLYAPDSYALAMILWQVLTIRPLWVDDKGAPLGNVEVWRRIVRGERPPVTKDEDRSAPRGYVALMRELWHHDPAARPSSEQALRRLQQLRIRKKSTSGRGSGRKSKGRGSGRKSQGRGSGRKGGSRPRTISHEESG